MALKKGSKIERGYATIAEDDGVNYREISEVMTEMGWTMNHSSARNYVLRAMRKFADAYQTHAGVQARQGTEELAKSPGFQSFMSDVLWRLESERKVST